MRKLHDLVMTYKILFGKIKVNMHDFFSYANSDYNTHGHCFKLFTQHRRVNQFFLAKRVVEPWNRVPAAVLVFSSSRVFQAFLKFVDISTSQTVSFN